MRRVLVNSANWRLGGGVLTPQLDEDDETLESFTPSIENSLIESNPDQNESGSEESEDEESDDENNDESKEADEEVTTSHYDPMRASQVTRRTHGLLSAAENLMGSGRDAMTESKQQQLGFHLGDLREIRQNLVVLIERYQEDAETLMPLLDLLGNVNSALERLGVNLQIPPTSIPSSSSSSSIPSSSTPSSSSSIIVEQSTNQESIESVKEAPLRDDEMIDMRSRMKLSQLYGLIDQLEEEEEKEVAIPPNPENDSNQINTIVSPGPSQHISLGDCSMCWEDMMDSNSRELECGHRFCDGCLSHYLKVLVEEAKVIGIKCPHQECAEEMCEEDMEELLEERDFARLQQLVFLTEIRQDPNARWCPRPGCETVCRLNPSPSSSSSSSSSSTSDAQRLECETCQFVFCSGCGLEYHPKLNCKRAAKKLAQREKKVMGRRAAKDKKKSLKAMKREGLTKCPGCRAIVEKASGCNHMTCRCGREFCYICGETLLQVELHYLTSACAGLQFSDVIELTTTAKVAQYARLAAMPVVVVGAAALALAVVPVGAAVYGVYSLRRRAAQRRRMRRYQQRHATPGDPGPIYHIAMLGERGVGKSSICIQLVYDTFFDDPDPTYEDTFRKNVMIAGQAALLQILDTVIFDEPRQPPIQNWPYYVLVYSITDRSSFEAIPRIIEKLLQARDEDTLPPSILLGNKSDMSEDRQVTLQEGYLLSKEYNMHFLESSAKLVLNIEQSFDALIQAARRNKNFWTE